MRRLDDATGMISATDTRVYSLARRAKPAMTESAPPGLPPNSQAIEAPFIVRHSGFFYLFTTGISAVAG